MTIQKKNGEDTIWNSGSHVYSYDIDRLKYQRDITLTNGYLMSYLDKDDKDSLIFDFKYKEDPSNKIAAFGDVESTSGRDDIEVIIKALTQSYDIYSTNILILCNSVKLNNPLYFELTNYTYHMKDDYAQEGQIQWNYQNLFTTLVFSLNTETSTHTASDSLNHTTKTNLITQAYSASDKFNTGNYGMIFENSPIGGGTYNVDTFSFKDWDDEESFTVSNHSNTKNYGIYYDYVDSLYTGQNKKPDEYTAGIVIDLYNGKLKVYNRYYFGGNPSGIYDESIGYLGAKLSVEHDIPKLSRIELNTIVYDMRILASVYNLGLIGSEDWYIEHTVDSEGNPCPFDCRLEFNFGTKDWKIPNLAKYFSKQQK